MLEDRIFSELSPTRARRIAVLAACLAVALGAATLGAALLAASPARAQVPAPSSRGEYLARIMDCGGCHTGGALVGQPDPRLHLAGSAQGFGIPDIGYFYPPNLTPDPETGLGAWSEADIIRAVRQGVRPDGRTLAPLMPWPSYGALTDEDAAALARYLKALPPVRHRVPPMTRADAPAPAPFLALVAPPKPGN